MARRRRLHVPGGFYHVTIRGNHRNRIFFRDSDRDLLDRLVADSIERLDARLHAYCWMTNHLHMVIQVSDVPLGRVVLRIASAYARSVQLRLETTGHLFERRYHAVLIDADSYLVTLLRYIHLNPVRAGLVIDPAAYPWSSHLTYLGIRTQHWVTTEFAMRVISPCPERAVTRYTEIIGDLEPLRWGIGSLSPNRAQPQILGDDAFVARVSAVSDGFSSSKTLKDLLGDCCERFQLPAELLSSPVYNRQLSIARAWLAHAAANAGVASISDVARLLGRTEGAIRQTMRRHPTGNLGSGGRRN